MPARELQLVAVGNITSTVMRDIEEPIQAILGVGAWQGKQVLPKPQYAFNKDRGQYHSNAIMRRLLTVREPGAVLMLGVCDVDLFVPDSPFVYGEADRESKTGVFSTFRLKSEGELFKKRVQAQGVHEAGHLVGLSYCEDVRCLMFFATSLADLDRRALQLCNNCRNELHKLRR
ncbi:MAG: non-proteolytic archaemetzincin-like protein [Myxococcaceae bacterium]|nr:non-proteolytic archaemetzincin-like protein [Myxococcaceae bacterium]